MSQLRTYTINQTGNQNALEAFVAEWRAYLVPLRESFEFKALWAYTVRAYTHPATSQFVWLIGTTVRSPGTTRTGPISGPLSAAL